MEDQEFQQYVKEEREFLEVLVGIVDVRLRRELEVELEKRIVREARKLYREGQPCGMNGSRDMKSFAESVVRDYRLHLEFLDFNGWPED